MARRIRFATNYTIKVVDPILMFKNLIPVDITSGQGRGQFDLGEDDGGVEESLFSGFVGSLATALSAYTKGGKSIDDIQGGTVEFAKASTKLLSRTTSGALSMVSRLSMFSHVVSTGTKLLSKRSTGSLLAI